METEQELSREQEIELVLSMGEVSRQLIEVLQKNHNELTLRFGQRAAMATAISALAQTLASIAVAFEVRGKLVGNAETLLSDIHSMTIKNVAQMKLLIAGGVIGTSSDPNAPKQEVN